MLSGKKNIRPFKSTLGGSKENLMKSVKLMLCLIKKTVHLEIVPLVCKFETCLQSFDSK